MTDAITKAEQHPTSVRDNTPAVFLSESAPKLSGADMDSHGFVHVKGMVRQHGAHVDLTEKSFQIRLEPMQEMR